MTDPARPVVLCAGVTYRDLVMSGLDRLPALGEERYATSFVETWGGVANSARMLASLGADCRLATPLGDDPSSAQCRAALEGWGIDLTPSRVTPGWSLPVTVSLAAGTERAMATVETPAPALGTPDLAGVDVIVAHLALPAADWLLSAGAAGITVVVDHGFEDHPEPELLDAVSRVTAYTPNAQEAMVLTGAPTPLEAARELSRVVPLVIVTCGADGIIGVDARTGEEVAAPAVPIRPVNTTGAGDATLAALAWTFRWPDLPLARRLDVAALVGALVTSRSRGTADPVRPDDLRRLASREPARFAFLLKLLEEPLD